MPRRRRAHDKHALVGDLGRRMFFFGVAIRGHAGVRTWRALLNAIADAMGMSPVGAAKVWRYPTQNGGSGKMVGGFGETICQPITESFLIVDTWPDHDGAYLVVSSCKPFKTSVVREVVETFGNLKCGEAIGSPDMLRLA